MNPANERGAAALGYALLGFAVLPLHSTNGGGSCSCGKKDCSSPGKHPRTAHGCSDATGEAEQIESWWTQWPDANVGLSTDGLWVLDIDPLDGQPNPWPGEELAAGFRSPVVRTPRGGRHYYFHGPGKNSGSRLAPSVDTRGEGGYVVVPPSSVGGVNYVWERAITAPDLLPEPPSWLDELWEQTGRRSALGPSVPSDRPAKDGGEKIIPEGRRDVRLASIAGKLRHAGLEAVEIEAALHRINLERCKPPLPEQDIRRIAGSIGRYEGPKESEEPTWENTAKAPIVESPSLAPLADSSVEYVIDRLLPRGALVLLQGPPKLGKSALATYLAAAASTGLGLGGSFSVSRPMTVLLVEFEDRPILIAKRLSKYLPALGRDRLDFPPNLLCCDWPELWLDLPRYETVLCAEILKRKIDYVILDTLSHLHRAEDENSSADMKPVMIALKRIAKETNACIQPIHHSAKSSEDRSIVDRARGSSLITAAADAIIDLRERKEKDITPVRVTSKLDESFEFSIRYCRMDGGCVQWEMIEEGEESRPKKGKREEVLMEIQRRTMESPKGFIIEDLAEALPSVSERMLYRYVQDFEREGMLWVSREGRARAKRIRFIASQSGQDSRIEK